MANRLASATSPYLLQHVENPVDWWEWGPEAFVEAKRRDAPILLSVGYAACHWCHVMAHESFEDAATAAYLNQHFVAVKVDREERPDVDAVYMTATQAMTGHGGWPMTCALTPGGDPFFSGTYFPDRPRQGMPSFRQVLEALVDAWTTKRDDIERVGADVVTRLRQIGQAETGGMLDAVALDAAWASLARQVDQQSGGFGAAPKFPPAMVLEFALRGWARTRDTAVLTVVADTCNAMARGGMYDQLAGGFARYCVDGDWVVPHFEKMLYDNALLLGVYLHWGRASGDPLAWRVAEETADFLLAELATAEGGFASALDADSLDADGRLVEGAFYAWTPEQLEQVLGPDDGPWVARLLAVTPAGTFEHGASTLQLRQDPSEPARWEAVRQRLRVAREDRHRPARDDKVVAAWNGLAIAALAEAGVLLSRPDLLAAAQGCGDLLADLHTDEYGRLWRTSREGRRGANVAVLDDYGCTAAGYLALLGATGDPRWLARAGNLLDQVLSRFTDGSGGFFDTASDAERLVTRPRDAADNASPAGVSSVAHALISYAAITGSARHRQAAEQAVASAGGLARQAPRFAGWTLAAAEALLAGPEQVAVVGAPGDADRATLHRAALARPSPGAVVVAGSPGTEEVPLLAQRPLVAGRAAAYVCRGFVCDRPVVEPDELAWKV